VTLPRSDLLATAVLTAVASLSGGQVAPAAPVTSHPRLWVRAADLPRLRSWAVASNPVYQDGLLRLATQAKADMDAGLVPGSDPGNLNYREYPTEIYAQLFAFMSLVSPDQASRDDYAARARTLLMFALDRAVLGPAPGLPFRDPCFASCDSNASKDYAEGFALTVDWIYPYLSPADKATIRTVFLRWSDEIVNLGYHKPEPVGVLNDPALVASPRVYRWAFNNYFVSHMRNLGFMAMALDAADDPGGSLRAYLANATGARLYMVDYLMRNDARGGLPPEGFQYGPQTTLPAIAQFMLALHTAGQDDPAAWGPQVAWNNQPFWADWVSAWLHSMSPQPTTFVDYIGPEYQPASYGDTERYGSRETSSVLGPMGVFAGLTGDVAQLSSLRWMQANLPPGGPAALAERARNPNSFTIDIFYFLLFDPSGGLGADPRSALPRRFFGPGLGRILARTGWDADANWFTYKLGWGSIDHQTGDGTQFEFYRRGEWLTKERAGYDLDNGSSVNHNALSIQNDPAPWPSTDYRHALSQTGSQWLYVSEDPRLLARSFGTDYVYALGDATTLYNYPGTLEGVTHASRSIIWLEPDHIVIYDRAATVTPGRFKRFALNVPALPAITGNRARIVTPSGQQQLVVTTLLPADAVITAGLAPTLTGDPAENNRIQHRLTVEAPGGPTSARFLHVLQGAAASAIEDAASLVTSTSGTPFAGAVVNDTAVLFPVDLGTAFSSVTYSVPSATVAHRITGLTPNGSYFVGMSTSGATTTVTVSEGGATNTADSGGVIAIGSVAPPPPPPPPPPPTPTVPGPPGSLTATASNFSVTIQWAAPASGGTPSSYVLEAGSAAAAANLASIDVGGATSYQASGVPPGRYFLRVKARNSVGIGAASNEFELVVGSDGGSPPGAPGTLTATMTGLRLTLTWSAPMSGGTATSYVLEVGGAPGLANIAALIVGSTSFSYEPVPFGLYYLRVRARNGSGTSAPSNEVRVSIVEVPLPGPPIGLAFAVNGSSVTLSWQAPATGGSPSGYVLEAGSASGLSNLAVFPTSGPVTSQTFTGVPAGRYFVRVRAANAAGVSVPSAEVEIVVP
jgi:hypothetical protein